jgi:hypothetical protein
MLYHGTCAVGWRWLGAPLAGTRRSTSSYLAIANMLGTGVQMKKRLLDSAQGLASVAVAAAAATLRLKFKLENFKLDITSSLYV